MKHEHECYDYEQVGAYKKHNFFPINRFTGVGVDDPYPKCPGGKIGLGTILFHSINPYVKIICCLCDEWVLLSADINHSQK